MRDDLWDGYYLLEPGDALKMLQRAVKEVASMGQFSF